MATIIGTTRRQVVMSKHYCNFMVQYNCAYVFILNVRSTRLDKISSDDRIVLRLVINVPMASVWEDALLLSHGTGTLA